MAFNCCLKREDCCSGRESNTWKRFLSGALAAAVIVSSSGFPAMADLNKFEADIRGEFGIGSAAQFGSADLRYKHKCFLSEMFCIKSLEKFHLAE